MVVGVMPFVSATGFLPGVRGPLIPISMYALVLVLLCLDVAPVHAPGLVIPKIWCSWRPCSLLGRSPVLFAVVDPRRLMCNTSALVKLWRPLFSCGPDPSPPSAMDAAPWADLGVPGAIAMKQQLENRLHP
uniref:Uncharacterized protein n=1 Tax=Arundo donax TaxID=35708 RepID=A0A0A9A4U6_ARUDO